MSNYVTLVGAEEVQKASHSIRSAAEVMMRAASQISESLLHHQQFLDDWLIRLQQLNHQFEQVLQIKSGENNES